MTQSRDLLNGLATVLAHLYEDEASARIVVAQAGLDPAYIDFSGSAMARWSRILAYAESLRRVEGLLQVATKDYPENASLIEAQKAYLAQAGAEGDLFSRLSPSSKRAITIADNLRHQIKHPDGDELYSELLLVGLNELGEEPREVFNAFGIGGAQLIRGKVANRIGITASAVSRAVSATRTLNETDIAKLPLSENTRQVLENAGAISREKKTDKIRARHILLALLEAEQSAAYEWLSDLHMPVNQVADILRTTSEGTRITSSLITASIPVGAMIESSRTGRPRHEAKPDTPVLPETTGRVLGMAEQIKQRDRRGEIFSTHLLLALYMVAPETSVHNLLSAFGVDYREILQTLTDPREVEDLLMSKMAPSAVRDFSELQLSDSVRDILQAAQEKAPSKSVAEIQPRHVFAAMLEKSDASATRWLNDVLSPEVTQWIAHTVPELDETQALTVEAVQQRAVKDGLYIAPTGVRDNAADTDLLGFAIHADSLASIILRDETKPPLVVGVYGPWGSGKSTFMQLVKQSLTRRATLVGTADRLTRRQHIAQFFKDIPGRFKKRPPVTPRPELIILEYDAWAYADAPKLWAGLVAQIAKELDAQLGFRGRLTYIVNFRMKQLRNALLWGLVPVAVYIGGQLWNEFARTVLQSTFIADGLTLISSAFWGIKLFQAQKQPVSASIETLTAKFDTEPMSGVVHSIQDEVKNALNTKFPQPKPEDSARRDTTQSDIAQRVRENKLKIVVLIDELDRCPLERVVDILEAIKLFLSEEIFIVLMAIDTRVAAEAIRLHYKDVKNPDLPHEYLEKIVQLPLQVPRAGDAALKVYLNSHMPTAAAAIKQEEEKEKKEADKLAAPTNLDIVTPPPSIKSPTTQPRREPPIVRRADSISSRPKFSDTPTEFEQVADLAQKFLESNPRRIKRLLNTYRYVKMLANAQHEPVDDPNWQKATLAWLVFTMRWPAFIEAAYNAREELRQKYPDSKNILKDALNDDTGEYDKPREQDINAYLQIGAKRLQTLYETAGNFLIEIPMVSPDNQRKEANGEKPGGEQEPQAEVPENV
jgi:hypothetical protein